MFFYLLKRILLFVPTLLIVSVLAFGLNLLSPGDQVLKYMGESPFGSISSPHDLEQAERLYELNAERLNLDKPPFYFSITSKAYPDSLHKIMVKDRRVVLEKLIAQYGNWPQIEIYYHSIRSLHFELMAMPDSLKRKATSFKLDLTDLYVAYLDGGIMARLERMEKKLEETSFLSEALGGRFMNLKKNYEKVKNEATQGSLYMPAFRWNGLRNQYHQWMTNFVKGDFGISVFEKLPVREKVGPALFWTVLLNVNAIILAFLLAVPLGIWSAVKKGSRFDKGTSLGLFMMYSLPSFWIGTMLLVFFTTREYGMDFFPGPGLGNIPSGASLWEKISIAYPHLLLPIFCLAYPPLAFIARQARGGMIDVLNQEYIKTARAKGLPERTVIWKHAFKNALFPLITMLASVLPSVIGGSIAIEYVFNIPGMGLVLWNAIMQQDWPIISTILMLGSVLTIVGIFLADILYAVVDPRVKLEA